MLARLSSKFPQIFLVGLLGIEPSLSAPKADVLPVYYSPNTTDPIMFIIFVRSLLRLRGYEAGLL